MEIKIEWYDGGNMPERIRGVNMEEFTIRNEFFPDKRPRNIMIIEGEKKYRRLLERRPNANGLSAQGNGRLEKKRKVAQAVDSPLRIPDQSATGICGRMPLGLRRIIAF